MKRLKTGEIGAGARGDRDGLACAIIAFNADESRIGGQAVEVPQSLYQKLDNTLTKARPVTARTFFESTFRHANRSRIMNIGCG